MKNAPRIAAISLLLLAALVLGACGSDTSSPSAVPDSADDTPTLVVTPDADEPAEPTEADEPVDTTPDVDDEAPGDAVFSGFCFDAYELAVAGEMINHSDAENPVSVQVAFSTIEIWLMTAAGNAPDGPLRDQILAGSDAMVPLIETLVSIDFDLLALDEETGPVWNEAFDAGAPVFDELRTSLLAYLDEDCGTGFDVIDAHAAQQLADTVALNS